MNILVCSFRFFNMNGPFLKNNVLLVLWIPHHYLSGISVSDVLSLEIKWGIYVWFIFHFVLLFVWFFPWLLSMHSLEASKIFFGWFSHLLSALVINVVQSRGGPSHICAAPAPKSSCLWMAPPARFPQHNGRGVCRWKPLNRSVDDIQDETKFAAWHFLAVLALQERKLIYITGTDNYYRMHGERRFAE